MSFCYYFMLDGEQIDSMKITFLLTRVQNPDNKYEFHSTL